MAEAQTARPAPNSALRDALELACTDVANGQEVEAMGRVLAAIAREYTRACERGVVGPVFSDEAVTVTEVAVLVSAMMEAVELEVFELGMWKSLGSI